MCDLPDIPDLQSNPDFYKDKQLNIFGIRYNLLNEGDVAELQKKFGVDANADSSEYHKNIEKNHLFFYMFFNISKYSLDDQLKCIEARCFKFIRDNSPNNASKAPKHNVKITGVFKSQLENVRNALQEYINSNTDIIKYHSNTISEHWRFTVFTYIQKLIYKIDMWIDDEAKPRINSSILSSNTGVSSMTTVPASLTLRLDIDKIYSFIDFIKAKAKAGKASGKYISISQRNINNLNLNINNSGYANSGAGGNNDGSTVTIYNENHDLGLVVSETNNAIHNNSKDFYIYVVDKILKESMKALYETTTGIITGGFTPIDSLNPSNPSNPSNPLNLSKKEQLKKAQCDKTDGIFVGNRSKFMNELKSLIGITNDALKLSGEKNVIIKISTKCIPLLYNFIIKNGNIIKNKAINEANTTYSKSINIFIKKDSIILRIKKDPITSENTDVYYTTDPICNLIKNTGDSAKIINEFKDIEKDYTLFPSMNFILILYIQMSKGVRSEFCEQKSNVINNSLNTAIK